jgi:dolichyl-phosphate-mannose--protein O-mannosyl transferase
VRLLSRPLPLALLIGLVAQLVFAAGVTTPRILVFDEIHYVPAARILLELRGPWNIEHPLLGKALIALGMMLFGDTPLGWRALSTVAGTATVMSLFAAAWHLFRSARTAGLAALFALGNMTLFVQARIAMLDGFMAALIVGALAAMLWSMRSTGPSVWRRWLLGAVLLGLAAGVKWVAFPYVALAGAGFLLARAPHRWPGLRPVPALLTLGLASAAAYLLTFLPAFFYADQPLTLAKLLPFQLEMYRQQTQVLPRHSYQSAWWSWPLMLRPIWYLYEPVDGVQRGIILLGNPAVMWGGLLAVAACAWAFIRERSAALGGVAALWLAGWGMWALIPKSLGFFYYYYLPSLWLPLAIAAAFHRYAQGEKRYWDEAALALTGGLFVYFHPILAAEPLAGPGAFQRWMWFSSWI